MGIVRDTILDENSSPPSLPIAVMVQFHKYSGPNFSPKLERCLPILPIIAQSDNRNDTLERQQLPLKLCYAMTIHKAQGLTLGKVQIDLGKQESVAGLAYVVLSRVEQLHDLVIEPMSFERLQAVTKLKNFMFRCQEET